MSPDLSGASPGPGVDARGRPVIDPTANVLREVASTTKRLDDLRDLESRHLHELMKVRAEYDEKLRAAETARINAIRAVDVGAVQRAAEVSATQAATLATQVSVSAETLRGQVAATELANRASLAAALEPVQKDIADLRRAQYEAQGVKAQTGETRLNVGTILGAMSLALVLVFGVLTIVLSLVLNSR